MCAQRWEKNYPRAAQQIREQFEQTLAVHDLPPKHRRRAYTTNVTERLMHEVKRRTRVVGIFPLYSLLQPPGRRGTITPSR